MPSRRVADGNHPEYGVAAQIMYFASVEDLQRGKSSAVAVLLSAAQASEFGEELMRQDREALGYVGRKN